MSEPLTQEQVSVFAKSIWLAVDSGSRRRVENLVRKIAARAPSDPSDQCGGCGGPYIFDTTVPSAAWNAAVRAKGMNEYLCLGCVVAAFAKAGVSFTATLIGGDFDFLPIEVQVRGQAALDVELLDRENTLLRSLLVEIEQGERA